MLKESLQLPAAILGMLALTSTLVVALTPAPTPLLAPGSPSTTPHVGGYLPSLYIPTTPPADCGAWAHFATEAELRARLAPLYPYPMMGGAVMEDGSAPPTPMRSDSPLAGSSATQTASGSPPSYTGTNVQVVGIDEPDVVKTDGWYIYTVTQGTVSIVRAYPPQELSVVSTIKFEGQWPSGLFVNGNQLVVLSSAYYAVYLTGDMDRASTSIMPYAYTPTTAVMIYDISDPAHPALTSNITLSGFSSGARMMGYEVFVVATNYLYLVDDKVPLPTLTIDGQARTLSATEIGYFPEAHNSSSLTEVLVVNLTHPKDAHLTAVLADSGSTLYMSRVSIYLVGFGGAFAGPMGEWLDASTIHRLYVNNGRVACAVTGEVRGHVLNQYSLDEWGGSLRVATTEWTDGRLTANHVFILDGSLKVTGSLDNIAPGETIQAVRFLAERAYVVTFRQIDPFFVIDLSNVTAPRVLGELKITGFSQYLHPIAPGYVLGIGTETSAPDATGRTVRTGLKLSLFDVRDVSAPREVSKYVIEGSSVSSEVQWDAHALLWVPARHLLAIPVDVYLYTADGSWGPSSYWQGVYVFTVTPEAGIEVVGKITHTDSTAVSGWGYYGLDRIRRTLQIGDYLYTVSDTAIEVHTIPLLQRLARVTLWTPPAITGPTPMGSVSSPGAM